MAGFETNPTANLREVITPYRQRTLTRTIHMEGKGLHGGDPVGVSLGPAQAGTGITFFYDGLSVPAHAAFLAPARRSTSLQRDGKTIETVEHLLSACWIRKVDNLVVQVEGGELPAGDGSLGVWLHALSDERIGELHAFRKVVFVARSLWVGEGGRYVFAFPAPSFSVHYLLDFFPAPRVEYFGMDESDDYAELGRARTFAFQREIEGILSGGFGQGVRESAIIFGEDGRALSHLRMEGEGCAHKILDLVGDLMLVGKRLVGQFVAIRSGHELNHLLVKKLIGYDDYNQLEGRITGEY